MIWLPGVLSQGGDKFTWARYTVKYQETISGNITEVFRSQTIIWDYNYKIEGNYFVLSNNFRSNINILSAGRCFTTGSSNTNLTEVYETVSITANGDNTYTITYKLHKMQGSADVYVDTVESKNGSDFPENGEQGGYWYIKLSDTPITWERYAFTESMVQGESVTQTATSSTYFYRATSYGRSGKTFTATGTRTRASSLAVGNYLIQKNGSFVSSTNMSGDTLFEITAKTTSGYSNVSLTFATYTIGDVKGSYIDTVTSYNPYEYPDDGAQDGYWYVKV